MGRVISVRANVNETDVGCGSFEPNVKDQPFDDSTDAFMIDDKLTIAPPKPLAKAPVPPKPKKVTK